MPCVNSNCDSRKATPETRKSNSRPPPGVLSRNDLCLQNHSTVEAITRRQFTSLLRRHVAQESDDIVHCVMMELACVRSRHAKFCVRPLYLARIRGFGQGLGLRQFQPCVQRVCCWFFRVKQAYAVVSQRFSFLSFLLIPCTLLTSTECISLISSGWAIVAVDRVKSVSQA